jgi:nitrite reductase/ring-hydroxylating ferredoxin subunit
VLVVIANDRIMASGDQCSHLEGCSYGGSTTANHPFALHLAAIPVERGEATQARQTFG